LVSFVIRIYTLSYPKLKTMKRISILAMLSVLLLLPVVKSSAQIFQLFSREEFDSPLNTGYSFPINAAYSSRIGNWQAFSNSNSATAAVAPFANAFSAPYCAELVTNSNAASITSSVTQITSPEISLSGVMCTGKLDFFCWIYGEQVASGNSGTRFKVEFFDGTNWNTVWDHSPNWIFNNYGSQNWAQIYLMLSPAYYISNFRYRISLTNPAGNTNTTKIRVDNIELYNYSCGGTAALGDHVWIDTNGDGMQSSSEKGYKGMTVDLYNASNVMVASTVTGDDGCYHFFGVPPGTYTVNFRSFTIGYVNSPKNMGGDATKDSDPEMSTGRVSVTLAADEYNETIDFGLIPGSLVLPLKLVSFNAAYNNTNQVANISWKMEGNDGMNNFELERSTDGTSFSSLGVVLPAAGESASYQYPDNISAVNGAIVYYRLLMNEKNGTAKYSNVIVVRKDKSPAQNTLQLMPNPAGSNTSIRLNAEMKGSARVLITDMSGRTVTAFDTKISEGVNTVQINNLESYQRGFYMVQVRMQDKTWTSKLILQ
jgi:hypothetical protein